MRWFWPHFKRLWAMAATVIVGLTINYLYGLWGEQSVPSVHRLSRFLGDSWYWAGGALMLFAIVSVIAARAHRRHEAPHFIGATPGRRLRRGAKVQPLSAPAAAATLIVGREGELTQLRDWFARVLNGERRVVFVAGEAGIGKTMFVRSFLDSLEKDSAVRIGRGQCVEQYGAGEPYMPMLEVLTQLGRGAEGPHLLALLHRLAPAWLAQLPALLTAEERARIQGETHGLTQQRMLREMAETLAALTADAPLVLLLEDLHWSDASTLDLIAAIARRTEPARLMVIGTHRPVEMLAMDHPLRALKQELELHRQCEELRLKRLSEGAVAAYLRQRFANDASQYSRLAPAIYQRSEGNPLFMVNVVDYLVAQGPLLDTSKIEVPRNIIQMIERNLDRLSLDERRVLQAASVAGAEFSAASIAAAVDRLIAEIEECCSALARQGQFIGSRGGTEWPDATVAGSYAFLHALYLGVLYERTPPGQRVELHRRIAERAEAAWGDRGAEIAAELAHHFSSANDRQKGIQYFQLAGDRAVARGAMVEAEQHYVRALGLLGELPKNIERDHRELELQLALGPALISVKGYAAPEVEGAYTRARELCEPLGDPPELFPVLFGLWVMHLVRGEVRKAYEFAEQLLRRAQRLSDRALLLLAEFALETTSYWMGECLPAKEHYEMGISIYDPEHQQPLSFRYLGVNPGVGCPSYAAQALWQLGYPDQALKRSNEALALAQGLSHSFSLAFAKVFVGYLCQFRREARAAQENAESAIALCAEHGLTNFLAWATIIRGWAMAEQGRSEEGVAQIQEGMVALRATGAELTRPRDLCFLAKACMEASCLDDGLSALSEALLAADEHETRNYEPEMHRLKGELLLRRDASNVADAEHCFQRAIEIARKQSAKSWELRATTSLARLMDKQGKRHEAHVMLAEIYGWFTEGFDTADLKDAKALLDQLNA